MIVFISLVIHIVSFEWMDLRGTTTDFPCLMSQDRQRVSQKGMSPSNAGDVLIETFSWPQHRSISWSGSHAPNLHVGHT